MVCYQRSDHAQSPKAPQLTTLKNGLPWKNRLCDLKIKNKFSAQTGTCFGCKTHISKKIKLYPPEKCNTTGPAAFVVIFDVEFENELQIAHTSFVPSENAFCRSGLNVAMLTLPVCMILLARARCSTTGVMCFQAIGCELVRR